MDLQDDFFSMFTDSDDEILINGVTVAGFIARPGVIQEPFYSVDGELSGVFVIVQKSDLETLGQWPLDNPSIELDGIFYRVIRPHENAGHVQIFLQEA